IVAIAPAAGARERMHFAGVLVRRDHGARCELHPHRKALPLDIGHQQLQANARVAGPALRPGQSLGVGVKRVVDHGARPIASNAKLSATEVASPAAASPVPTLKAVRSTLALPSTCRRIP